jgi:mRNA-degrading endonuclease RelE of RelBE toxin-antitoxin system
MDGGGEHVNQETVDDDQLVVLVISVGDRGEVYR